MKDLLQYVLVGVMMLAMLFVGYSCAVQSP